MTDEMTPIALSRILRPRPAEAHKGTLGHALLVAGRWGVGGCAILAAESCMRAGVGKLTVCTPECNRILLQLSVPEAILHVQTPEAMLPDTSGRGGEAPWQAIGIGPGIGLDAGAQLYEAVTRWNALPVVVDADALRLLADHPQWLAPLRMHALLTPHAGEMSALAQGILQEQISSADTSGLQAAAQRLAMEHDLWVVLKGHPTRIFHPSGQVTLCPRGNAGMATAGAGDVLTGILTGLLAQGYGMAEAACLGVWLHATAGDRAAQQMGQEAMLARDITAHLADAWRELWALRTDT